jgi:hypothetical protein
MRKLALLGSFFLLSAMWVVAQYNNPIGSPRGNLQETTIAGCVDQEAETFTLTLASGAIFQLAGNTAQLKAHVGELMQVTGVASPVTNVPGSMSEGEQTSPTLWVSSFRPISGVCTEYTNTIPNNIP